MRSIVLIDDLDRKDSGFICEAICSKLCNIFSVFQCELHEHARERVCVYVCVCVSVTMGIAIRLFRFH